MTLLCQSYLAWLIQKHVELSAVTHPLSLPPTSVVSSGVVAVSIVLSSAKYKIRRPLLRINHMISEWLSDETETRGKEMFPHPKQVPFGLISSCIFQWPIEQGQGFKNLAHVSTFPNLEISQCSLGSRFGFWATKSEGVGLIVCAISFQDFQPMWSQITNVTDGRHAIARPRFASRGNNNKLMIIIIIIIKRHFVRLDFPVFLEIRHRTTVYNFLRQFVNNFLLKKTFSYVQYCPRFY